MQFIPLFIKPSHKAVGVRVAGVEGPRVLLRPGRVEDWPQWSAVRERNRAHLTPWEPLWAKDALSYPSFCANLRRQTTEAREGKGYMFLVFLKPDRPTNAPVAPQTQTPPPPASTKDLRLIGGVSLSDIIHGIAQRATLGYWMDEALTGQGLMTEAAGLVCDFAFDTLGLHRIEATCLPHNHASARVLEKLAFTPEGLARSYLRINGEWQDHMIWAKINHK